MNCRFGPKQAYRDLAELAPGANAIGCELEVGSGEFSAQLHVFVDDQGAREIIFMVHGHANGDQPTIKKDP
jgi:hypothetical protein